MDADADAVRLLEALRAAGCDVFVEDGQVFCSPPAQRIEWDGDPEEALEDFAEELRDLLVASSASVH